MSTDKLHRITQGDGKECDVEEGDQGEHRDRYLKTYLCVDNSLV